MWFSDRRSRLTVVLAAVAALGALALPSAQASTRHHAAKPARHTRVVRLSYAGPCAFGVVLPDDAVGVTNCIDTSVQLLNNETYVSVSVQDMTGLPVTFMYEVDGGDQSAMCGPLKSLPVLPGSVIQLMPLLGATETTCVPPTQGTVTVTLTNYR